MSAKKVFHPKEATRPLEIVERELPTLTSSIFSACLQVIDAHQQVSPKDGRIETCMLVKDMLDTHRSMQAICNLAHDTDEPITRGCLVDMTLHVRPQYDRVLIGVLLLHNPGEWLPTYYKAGWSDYVKQAVYFEKRYSRIEDCIETIQENENKLIRAGKDCGLTETECNNIIGELRKGNGKPLDELRFPYPATISTKLKGSSFEKLSEQLTLQWKQFCPPQHVSVNFSAYRATLRSESEEHERIKESLIHSTLLGSLVSIISLATAIATQHSENVDLIASITAGWDKLPTATTEGSLIWEEWAKSALGCI